MKGTALLLLCAITLAQAEQPLLTYSGKVCNCNPDEANNICSQNGSNNALVIHENCNQFYKCANGVPVAFFCPGSTLYNPLAETCDWPHNVQCGDRPIVAPDTGVEDSGEDDGGSDTGTGTCNCNPEEAPAICAAAGSTAAFVAHEHCNQFYQCNHGVPVTMNCPQGLVYNPYQEICDWPSNVDCAGKPIVEIDSGGNDGGENNENGSGDNEETCNCDPAEAPSICRAPGSNGVLIAHENCNQFYQCVHGVPVSMTCPANLLYNPYIQQCDWRQNVVCGNRIDPDCDCDNGNEEDCDESSNESSENSSGGENENNNNNNDISDSSGADNGGSDGGDGTDNGGTDGDSETDNGGTDGGGGTCNCNPEEAPAICKGIGSEGVLIAHENCNQFYKCDNGVPVALFCPGILLYNPETEICDWPHNVDCGNRTVAEIEEEGEDSGTDNGGSGGGDGTDNGGSEGGGGTCNCNPEEAPSICKVIGSEGVLIAHENCNQFYKCDNDVPVALFCPGTLLYNPETEICDWPQNVDCGNRTVAEIEEEGEDSGTDNGGSGGGDGTDNGGPEGGGGTCNCNPEEAPAICKVIGSEGVLIAHENCNQFYKCDNDVPVALFCPGTLLYNPETEICDWPQNVDCGNRTVADIEEEGEDSGTDNGGSGGGDGTDNGGPDGGGGTCNCNPEEAPAICKVIGSEGVLIAHENCNQFYKCDNGVPVALFCPGILLYNPETEICDWPQNVDCGNRTVAEIEEEGEDSGTDNGGSGGGDGIDNGGPDGGGGTCNCNPEEAPAICKVIGSEGVLIAHENCNQFYKCDNDVPVALFCPGTLLYNPETEICDWPQNVDCGNRTVAEIEEEGEDSGTDNGGSGGGDGTDNGGSDGGGGTCNCNPEEAPSICKVIGSEGVLIAHENCNQFYKCDNDVPVALFCPGILLYNPETEICDWPQNVDCGNRTVAEIEEEGEDSGTDNGGSGGGDGNDNGGPDGGGGTCNCNPEEAPAICKVIGSEGVLIAHENCNQFYKCDNDVPVALFCPGILLYNPETEICDWPQNVDCGNRTVAEIEEEGEDSDNTEIDDNSSSYDGCEDSGSTTCNCNPDNAPSLCAAAGSNGYFVAHENCNQFYQCANGVPVALFCPNGLLYRPNLMRCDWPSAVKCGNRPIVDNDAGGEENGGDNGGTDPEGEITCNCNPNEAPSICRANGSDGTLVAHQNCNQFYRCVHGVPVSVSCSNGLLYNPYTERCDWPSAVQCGDRPIVEIDQESNEDDGEVNNIEGSNNPNQAPAICAASDSDGILVANENCNQYYVCRHGVPVAVKCPLNLLYNPITTNCDWPSNVDCGDRIVPDDSGSDGPCACDARQAPSICAGEDSSGKLIAHENCNQYYVCFDGSPVARSCPQSLLYDPQTEQCLRPRAVSCEGRVVPFITSYSSLNKHIKTGRGFF